MAVTQYQLLPDLTDEEYRALKADIAVRGILVPIEIDEDGNVLDGHHRLMAWRELKAEGIRIGDYPRIIRAGMTEEQKRNHVRALNMLRRHLTKEQRDEQMRQMRGDGASYEDIAQASGVSQGTAWNVTHEVQFFNSEELPGKDGKYYPPTHQRHEKPISIFAGTSQDEKRAKQASEHIEDAPDHIITTNRAARIAREEIAQERRQEIPNDVITGTARLIFGDFRELAHEITDQSIDLIFTDPPYPEESLSLWRDLAVFAARVLKPDGLLIAYTGAMYLPQVLAMLGENLDYWWAGSIILHGPHSRVHARQIAQGSKPLLFYTIHGGKARAWFEDTYVSEGEQKDAHDWQQSIGAARYYITTLTAPGDVVVDPFLGGGTTGVAAVELGRAFIGYEVEATAFSGACERIQQYEHNSPA